MQLITAKRPFSVFCGLGPNATGAQMPPKSTLGKLFFIPPIRGINMTNASISITASEDSTVHIIAGDYHNLDIYEWTGGHFRRSIVNDTVSRKQLLSGIDMAMFL